MLIIEIALGVALGYGIIALCRFSLRQLRRPAVLEALKVVAQMALIIGVVGLPGWLLHTYVFHGHDPTPDEILAFLYAHWTWIAKIVGVYLVFLLGLRFGIPAAMRLDDWPIMQRTSAWLRRNLVAVRALVLLIIALIVLASILDK